MLFVLMGIMLLSFGGTIGLYYVLNGGFGDDKINVLVKILFAVCMASGFSIIYLSLKLSGN